MYIFYKPLLSFIPSTNILQYCCNVQYFFFRPLPLNFWKYIGCCDDGLEEAAIDGGFEYITSREGEKGISAPVDSQRSVNNGRVNALEYLTAVQNAVPLSVYIYIYICICFRRLLSLRLSISFSHLFYAQISINCGELLRTKKNAK